MSTEKCGLTARQAQAAETRQKLLNASLELFAEKGYNATTVRSINRRIGMADGLLYHYFPGGKPEILKVLVKEEFDRAYEEFSSGFARLDSLPLEDALESMFQSILRLCSQRRAVLSILIREGKATNIIEDARLKELSTGGRCFLPEMLRKRALSGEIKEMDYECAAGMLGAVIVNHLLATLSPAGRGILDDEDARRRLIAYQVDLWKR